MSLDTLESALFAVLGAGGFLTGLGALLTVLLKRPEIKAQVQAQLAQRDVSLSAEARALYDDMKAEAKAAKDEARQAHAEVSECRQRIAVLERLLRENGIAAPE